MSRHQALAGAIDQPVHFFENGLTDQHFVAEHVGVVEGVAVFDDEPVNVQLSKRAALAIAGGGALLVVVTLVALFT